MRKQNNCLLISKDPAIPSPLLQMERNQQPTRNVQEIWSPSPYTGGGESMGGGEKSEGEGW